MLFLVLVVAVCSPVCTLIQLPFVACRRRYAAYKAGHDSDSSSLKASQAAEQLWWDDKQILLEAAATAEAEAAAAASAKYAKSMTRASQGVVSVHAASMLSC